MRQRTGLLPFCRSHQQPLGCVGDRIGPTAPSQGFSWDRSHCGKQVKGGAFTKSSINGKGKSWK